MFSENLLPVSDLNSSAIVRTLHQSTFMSNLWPHHDTNRHYRVHDVINMRDVFGALNDAMSDL